MIRYFFNKTSLLKSFLAIFSLSMLMSHNLIYFFISWVGLNISLYSVLLGAGTIKNTKSIGPSEVVVKYFIVGAMLTTFFLFTMVLYAINYLTFDIDSIGYFYFLGIENYTSFYMNLSERLFFITIVSLLLFKLGAFPFHFYLADLYSILCPLNTMFTYTVTLKVFVFLTLIQVISNFWFLSDTFYPLIVISSIGSIVAGAIGALSQHKIKQFFAYSYLNSMGFVLLGMGSGISFGFGSITFYSASVYFASYMFAWLMVLVYLRWSLVIRSAEDISIRPSMENVNNLFIPESVTGLIRGNRWRTYGNRVVISCLVVAILSFLGLPPTIGFYAKALVYFGLMGSGLGQILLILSLIFTPIMAYSYLRLLVKIIYPAVVEYANKVNSLRSSGLSLFQLMINFCYYSLIDLIITALLLFILVHLPVFLITTIVII